MNTDLQGKNGKPVIVVYRVSCGVPQKRLQIIFLHIQKAAAALEVKDVPLQVFHNTLALNFLRNENILFFCLYFMGYLLAV